MTWVRRKVNDTVVDRAITGPAVLRSSKFEKAVGGRCLRMVGSPLERGVSCPRGDWVGVIAQASMAGLVRSRPAKERLAMGCQGCRVGVEWETSRFLVGERSTNSYHPSTSGQAIYI